MTKATIAAIPNNHQLIETLYGKFCSQLFIAHHATGNASNDAIKTGFRKVFDNIVAISITLAPSTFRIPISFILCSALKADNPNNPMQPTNMAIIVNMERRALSLSSDLYIWSKLSSKNL